MVTVIQALTLQIDIYKHGEQFHAEIQNYDTGETFVGKTVGSLNEAVTTVVNSVYPADDVDDDPQCTNCGVYRSEHALLRASDCDGFTTKPGGSIVYTSSDLAEMSPDEIDDLFGRGNDSDRDPDDDEYQCGECDTIWKKKEGYECPGCNVTVV